MSNHEIGSGLVSFEMIFEALQSELFRFKLYSMSSKILKIPEFNLLMENSNIEIDIKGYFY